MVTIPNTNYWLIDQARRSQTKIAVSSKSYTFSYRQLYYQATTAAELLYSKGIDEGDNVCIHSKHSYEFWIIVNALWLLGAVPVPLSTRNTNEEISWQINHVKAKHLITFYSEQELKNVNQIVLDSFDFQNNQINEKHIVYSPFYSLRPSLILFTSGSTGKPKAVVHTFKSLFESVKAIDASFGLSDQDVWLASLPLYHIGGFMILVRSLLTGSSAVFPESLKHDDVINSIQDYNPSHISVVSTTLNRILESKQGLNDNLKYLFLGGGPISKEIFGQALLIGLPVVKVYGSTETCSMICALKPEELSGKAKSVGKVISEQIKIMSTSKNEYESGEILISSPTLLKEYFNEEKTTKQKITKGFYHTGDFGWIDNDGYLFINSRREDIIISGGENISAIEIETELRLLETVKDCYVFAQNDNSWGQIVCAAIVSKDLSEEELKSFLRSKLASFKIPKKFFFVEEIPRNEMGKVKRLELIQTLSLDEI